MYVTHPGVILKLVQFDTNTKKLKGIANMADLAGDKYDDTYAL